MSQEVSKDTAVPSGTVKLPLHHSTTYVNELVGRVNSISEHSPVIFT